MNSKDEIFLHLGANDSAPAHTCYVAHAGVKGWCATCSVAKTSENDDETNLCTVERWTPAKVKTDKHW